MFKSKEVADIVLNVIFIGTFLGIFFFTYAVQVEEEILEIQINDIILDLKNDLSIMPPEILATIKQGLQNVNRPDMTQVDAVVNAQNKNILKQAIMVIGISLATSLIGIYGASVYWKFSMIDLIKKNLIIMAFIGLTEFLFLTFFAKNFMSADPNYVKLLILNRIGSI